MLLVALGVRVGQVIESKDWYAPATDSTFYDNIASSLADGDGFGKSPLPGVEGESAFRAPLYPTSLAVVYAAVGGHKWTWGRLANAVIGTVLVALIGIVAAQLWSRRAGFIALAIAAIYPPLILHGSSLNLEPLLVTLEVATLAAALQHRRAPRGVLWPVVAGALLGLAILTRELGFALVLPVALLLWTSRPRWSRRALTAPLLALLVAVAVLTPWWIRNAVKLHAWVPISTSSGVGFAGTYNETSRTETPDTAVWIPPFLDAQSKKVLARERHPTEVQIDRDLRAVARDYVLDHPTYPAQVVFWNTVRLFDLQGPGHALSIAPYIPYPTSLTRLSVYSFYALAALAIVGIFLPATRRVPRALWLVPILVYASIVVVSGNIRYRASLEPFVILLATVTVGAVLDRYEQRRLRTRPVLSTDAQ